ncbi:MAG: response regulator [Deltaproteobacteria bacterium]|nr:response regulator [Deltaproteobacteria bacterium]
MKNSGDSPASERDSAQQLRELKDRVEMLGEFNQIIATGLGLDKMSQTIAQQLAFRFSAQAAFVFLLDDHGKKFQVNGSFGASRAVVPPEIAAEDTLMGRALRIGGLLSVPDLSAQSDHGLDFLLTAGLRCIHTCSLEGRSGTIGTLVVGYKKERLFTELESSMFEEFARGAASALKSAKTQAELAAYAEKLEDLVQRRTADLAAQKESAEEANRAKSRFVANMSHELRTPLTAVIGYSSVVSDGVFGPINEKQREALHAIQKSSEHLKELIDEVLNLSRIEAGKEDPEPSRVELVSLIHQIYKLMTQTAVGKGIQLAAYEVSEEARGLRLWVDPRHVRQILMNLMSNAIKYTPSGGNVKVSTEVLGDKVRINVRDNGIGISQELIDRLFLRFERGSDGYSQSQTGTGIGLSLTKHLIEINGGTIGVDSTEGEGSNFWILVPLADVSALDSESTTSVPVGVDRPVRLDGLNVLVVDDNVLTCQVLEEIIRSCGGNAFSATTVAQAREIAEENDLDATLVDLAIPKESGIAFIDYIRRHAPESLSRIPIVVVSACVFEEDEKNALEHGASMFVRKPFKPLEIAKSIRELTTMMFLDGGLGLSGTAQKGEGA